MPWLSLDSTFPRFYRRVGLRSTVQGLRQELHRCLPELSDAARKEIIHEVQTRTPTIAEEETSWLADIPSREHLEWASSIVAAYEAVSRHVSEEEDAIEIMTRVTRAGMPSNLNSIFAALLRRSRHDSTKTTQKFISALLPQYGYPWKWQTSESKDGTWALTNNQCFYAQFMANHGHPKLTRVICALNLAWLNRIRSCKNGAQFDQDSYRTLGDGADQCRISFTKITTSAKT